MIDFESESGLAATGPNIVEDAGCLADGHILGTHALDALNDEYVHPLSKNSTHDEETADIGSR